MTIARTVLRDDVGFPESPRWRDGLLWISDITAQRVLCLSESGEIRRSIPFPGRPSGLGWLPDGRLLAVSMEDRLVLRRDDPGWAVHADLTSFTSAAINDMVVAPSGDAYVTGIGYVAGAEEQRATQILLVRPDGSVERQRGDLWRPNGCVITRDGHLIVAETRVHRLTRFRLESDGSLASAQQFALLPRGTWADGICLDEAGAVWAADPKGQACRRVSPRGDVVTTIDTAPAPCIACTLGGDDGRTLFLLLADLADFNDPARRRGRIDAVRVDVAGAGSP